MLKKCNIHEGTYHTKYKDGRTRCKKCASEAVTKRRRLIKLKAIEYKGGQCSVCKYSKCASSLAFHHKDPSQKDFSISRSGVTRSWERVRKELDKCILLCRNCHGELHERQWQLSNPELNKRLSQFSPNTNIKPLCSCGKELSKGAKQCYNCYKLMKKTKIDWPETEILIAMVKSSSYVRVGKKLGVSDNAVRKRIRNHPA